MSRVPLDPFSKVVDDQRRWDPEWYSWLTDLAASVPAPTDLTILEARIAALEVTSPPGLIFLSSQTAVSASSIAFTGLSNTAYDHYVFQFQVTGATNIVLNATMSNNNGASYNTYYWWSWVYGLSYSAGAQQSATQAAASIQVSGSGRGSDPTQGMMRFWPSTGTTLNFVEGSSVYLNTSGMVHNVFAGIDASTNAACNAIQFFMSSGNIGGRINLYGVRKT